MPAETTAAKTRPHDAGKPICNQPLRKIRAFNRPDNNLAQTCEIRL